MSYPLNSNSAGSGGTAATGATEATPQVTPGEILPGYDARFVVDPTLPSEWGNKRIDTVTGTAGIGDRVYHVDTAGQRYFYNGEPSWIITGQHPVSDKHGNHIVYNLAPEGTPEAMRAQRYRQERSRSLDATNAAADAAIDSLPLPPSATPGYAPLPPVSPVAKASGGASAPAIPTATTAGGSAVGSLSPDNGTETALGSGFGSGFGDWLGQGSGRVEETAAGSGAGGDGPNGRHGGENQGGGISRQASGGLIGLPLPSVLPYRLPLQIPLMHTAANPAPPALPRSAPAPVLPPSLPPAQKAAPGASRSGPLGSKARDAGAGGPCRDHAFRGAERPRLLPQRRRGCRRRGRRSSASARLPLYGRRKCTGYRGRPDHGGTLRAGRR